MPTALIRGLMVYKYYIMLPISILEGPVLMLACGILLRLGYLSLLPTALILAGGDFVDDIGWYYLGYYGGETVVLKVGRFVGLQKKNLEKAKRLFRHHYAVILFISKLTSGFGLAVPIVAAAGISRVPFGKYMLVNVLGEPIWLATLLSIGYYGGSLYLLVSQTLQWFVLAPIILIVIVGFLLLVNMIRGLIFKPNPSHES